MNKHTRLSELSCMSVSISRDKLNLDKTLNCGQTFLWQKSDNLWYGFIDSNLVQFSQSDTAVCIIGNITADQFRHYFDLDTSYEFSNLSEFESQCADCGRGIRILRQPFIECLVTFIISQNNNMTRIRKSLLRLCQTYGNAVQLSDHIQYTFPDVGVLSTLKETDWKDLGVGYRAKYLYQIFNEFYVSSNILEEYIMSSNLPLSKSIDLLQKLPGVGPKVANCIALFGLHHLNAFPVDTHINKILNEHRDYTLPRPDGLDGVMQQYMFYWDAFKRTTT